MKISMLSTAVLLLFAINFFPAEAPAASGRLVGDSEVAENFRKGVVLEGYRYYATGPHSSPSAIVGIHGDYRLRNDLWREIENNEAAIKEAVARMVNSDECYGGYLAGAALVEGKDRRIGVWYSEDQWTVVKVGDKGEVDIGIPVRVESEE